jgi:hypothetical protein
VDTLAAIHDALIDLALERADGGHDVGFSYELLDQLGRDISEVRVSGPVEHERASAAEDSDEQAARFDLGAGSQPPLSVGAGSTSRKTRRNEVRVRESGSVEHHILFGSVSRTLSRVLQALPVERVWILLDEWSEVPQELQPLLADLLRRCILPVQTVTVKIGAIEQRSKFRTRTPAGQYLGIEIGADMAADVNLDDFMVFGNDSDRAKAFFKELFFKHVQAVMLDAGIGDLPKDGDEFVRRAFTQQNAFSELVRAAEGVPRDAINVSMLAAMRAGNDPIGVPDVRRAAQDWYHRDKGRAVAANSEASDLLHWIIDEVIGSRRARAFLLSPADANHPLIRELYDARVLHIIKRGYSAQDEPGVRYDVFQIDYGCYVDLVATGTRAPQGLFQVETADGTEFVEVPADDYRSIRRAILHIDDFEERSPTLLRVAADAGHEA